MSPKAHKIIQFSFQSFNIYASSFYLFVDSIYSFIFCNLTKCMQWDAHCAVFRFIFIAHNSPNRNSRLSFLCLSILFEILFVDFFSKVLICGEWVILFGDFAWKVHISKMPFICCLNWSLASLYEQLCDMQPSFHFECLIKVFSHILFLHL